MRVYHRWSDREVKDWAEVFLLTEESTLITLEQDIGVSHSTTSWCFKKRLGAIDPDLYERVAQKIIRNSHRRGRKKKMGLYIKDFL